jgi:hypothetical protein
MRWSLCLPLAVAPLVCDCGTGDTGATPDAGGGGSDATTDTGATLDAGAPPNTETCSGDPSLCLFGTAQATHGFSVMPSGLRARLYRAFPSSNANDVVAQLTVAKDGTWAFSGLPAWAHYYVEIQPGFPADAGIAKTTATRIGPLAVPNATGAAIDVRVAPVQLDVFEGSAPGTPLQLQTVFARLAESTPGSASVSVLIGSTPTAMPYNSTMSLYYVQLAPNVPAQPTYQLTTSLMPGQPLSLVADPPQFAVAITSPSPAATVPSKTDLRVTWALQPAADYELVDLFWQMPSVTTNVYSSPQPRAQDVTQELIPGGPDDAGKPGPLANPGTYLLNVAFTKANCPAVADGCVHASTVANEQLTVQ